MIANTHLIGTHGKGKDWIAQLMKKCFHWIFTPPNFWQKSLEVFYIYLFFHSIIDRATENGQVDLKRRERLDSESENLKARKSFIEALPSEIGLETREMVQKLARQTSSEDFKIYSMFTITSCIYYNIYHFINATEAPLRLFTVSRNNLDGFESYFQILKTMTKTQHKIKHMSILTATLIQMMS